MQKSLSVEAEKMKTLMEKVRNFGAFIVEKMKIRRKIGLSVEVCTEKRKVSESRKHKKIAFSKMAFCDFGIWFKSVFCTFSDLIQKSDAI